jgi:inner membrane protein
MPTAFTHAFAGAAISTVAPRRFRGPRLAAGLALLAALPDLDVVAFGFGIPYTHPLGHRGFSHSLACAFLLALCLSIGLSRAVASPWSARAGLLLVAFLAVASHGFFDAFTDAGLGVAFFLPFSNQRFFFPWRPILTSPLSPSAFFYGRGLQIIQELARAWGRTSLFPRLNLPLASCDRPCARPPPRSNPYNSHSHRVRHTRFSSSRFIRYPAAATCATMRRSWSRIADQTLSLRQLGR